MPAGAAPSGPTLQAKPEGIETTRIGVSEEMRPLAGGWVGRVLDSPVKFLEVRQHTVPGLYALPIVQGRIRISVAAQPLIIGLQIPVAITEKSGRHWGLK
jgi:hypothetical protein